MAKEEDLDVAKEWAEDWYFGLRGKARAGLLKTEKTFGKAADQFEKEYEIITEGQRGPRWIEGHKIRLRLHLRPFFGELDARKGAGVSDAPGDDIIDRQSSRPLHDEIVTLRLVLKTAIRHGWLTHLPDLSLRPIERRARLFTGPGSARMNTSSSTPRHASTRRPRSRETEQVHDFVLFMANTGLRADEAKNASSKSR
jgi:hypothetical protein